MAVTRGGRTGLAIVILCALVAAACDGDFERMRDQPRYERYGGSAVFPDGKVMQQPVPATVPIETDASEPTQRWDMSTLVVGQERFAVYCSPCHGVIGDGQTEVAAHMPLRRPPSLHEARIVAMAPDQVLAVITHGYGFMPPYAEAMSAAERWAVVGYVRALQRSQATQLDALPESVQREARVALAGGRP
jgi:mono/diheme cytochrome c family protein